MKQVLMVVLLVSMSGCGAFGVRNFDAWGLKMEFAEGMDLHTGFNQIDRVDDRRGISPGPSYKPVAANKAAY